MKDFSNFNDFSGNVEESVKQVEKEYSGKSEKDILSAIVARAEQGKRDGTLSDGDIDNFYNAVAPSLTAQQRKKLKKIVEELKKI